MHRVVITGLGPVSSIGTGISSFSAALREGRSGISPINCFDPTGFPHINAGEVKDFTPGRILQRINPSCWGRSALFAAAAARLAVQDAQLDLDSVDPERVNVVIGTTCGESQVAEMLAAQILQGGFASQTPELLRQAPGSRLANAVSEELGVT